MNNKLFYVISIILLAAALGAAAVLTGDSPSNTPAAQTAPSAPSDSSFGNLKIQ